jgi:multidrug transporter EmrE-like cation transporter
MGTIASIWSGISIILMVLIGSLLFDEKLYMKDIFGIILIIIGIYLIQYDGNHLE